MGRWTWDGNIEFLGRVDQQVKVRGYRIELGEIETQLLKHPSIAGAVVIDRTDTQGDKYLIAYIVGVFIETPPETPTLKQYLSQTLPGYMIPSYFEAIDKIPLTANGKIDRAALPGPLILEKQKYKAPTGMVEKKLAAIWSEVLNLEEDKIGTRSDFFEIGGHSLRATILISRIHKDFNVKVPLGDFFSNPTIEGTAAYIERGNEDVYASIEPAEKKEYYALSPAQKRVFTMQQLNKDGIAFNIPMVMVLEGEIVRERFESAFREVIRRHESFRTSFHVVDREPVQFIHPDVDFQVVLTRGPDRPTPSPGHEKTVIDEFIKPFDLSRAPLLRVGLIRENQTRHILMVDMHHIVSDAVSMPLLVTDFAAFYQGDSLPPPTVHYKDYAAWQHSPSRSRLIAGPRDYWLERFAGIIPVLEMPTDYPRPAVMKFEGRHILFEIDEPQTAALRTLVSEQDATMYMVLLSIFNILLAKYSGQRDIVIGSPVAGRNHADLENIIGFFINVLPMRNFPEPSKTFIEFLNEVRGNTLDAFENQDYPFDELVEELRPPRDTGRNPIYDVVFTVLNLEVPRVEIPGLKLSGREAEGSNVKTDLRIAAAEDETNIQLVLSYSTALFKEDTAQRMVKRFLDVTRQLIENPQVLIKDISIADEIGTTTTGAQRSDEEEFEF
ncbi:MAG: hypothetical protein GY950_06680 [bacterium]|nr:hypothetical protein [bacterium]